jgi:hypothetical protein
MKDLTVNLNYFNTVDSNNKAYLLGFIAADGSLVKNTGEKASTTLTITIHQKDVQVLELLKRELNSSLEIKDITCKSKSLSSYKLLVKHKRFTISRKELIQDLKKYGLTEKKSLTMPNIIQNIPTKFKKPFIIGYFDGDGCFVDSLVTKKKHRYSKRDGSFLRTDSYIGYNSCISIKGTKDFLQGIVDFLDIPTYTLKKLNGQKIDILLIVSNEGILKFYDCYKDCDFYLQRKKDKFTRKIIQVQTISSPSA